MYRIIAIAVAVVAIIGGIWYKINTLENKIDELKLSYDTEVTNHNQTKLKLALKESVNKGLLVAIEQRNEDILELNKKQNGLLKEIADWESQPPKIKYIKLKERVMQKVDTKKIDEGVCEEGLELNKKISNLKYVEIKL